MAEINAAKVAKNGNIITPRGRLFFPMLFTAGPLARGETDEKKFGWSTGLLLTDDADLTVLNEAVEAVIKENCTPQQRAKNKVALPFMQTADQKSAAHLADDYPVFIRMKAKLYTKSGQKRSAPQVVDPARNVVSADDEADQVYSGRWARLSCKPFFYPPQSGGGYGVSLGLANVQLLDHADALAGGRSNPNDEFESVESGDLGDLE